MNINFIYRVIIFRIFFSAASHIDKYFLSVIFFIPIFIYLIKYLYYYYKYENSKDVYLFSSLAPGLGDEIRISSPRM